MLNKMNLCNQIEEVNVLPIFSIDHFFIQLQSSKQLDKNIRTNIENETNWISVINLEIGKLVIVRSKKDLKLYRSRVVVKYIFFFFIEFYVN